MKRELPAWAIFVATLILLPFGILLTSYVGFGRGLLGVFLLVVVAVAGFLTMTKRTSERGDDE